MKKHFKSINKKNIKRFLCVLNSAVLLTTTLYSPQVADEVSHWIMTARAAVDSNNLITENINSLRELYEFSASYANSNEYDTYDLHIGVDALEGLTLEKDHQFQKIDTNGNLLYHPNADSDEETTTETEYPAMETLHYTPIGTDSKPFQGQITLTATSSSYYPIYLDEPMFGCIRDSVEIKRIGGGEIPLSLNRSAPLGDDENEALFAQHVVHDSRSGSSPATWQIYINPSIDEHGTYHIYNFSGLFGEIGTATGDHTVVNVEFQNNAKIELDNKNVYADVQSPSNTGMICGKINTGSTVNVKLLDNSDSSYSFNVVSFNGSAGKLVGEMTPSSILNVKTSNIAMLPSTGTVAAKEYAGSLVGKNDCGSVSITDLSDPPIPISYTSSGTILAEIGAGGIFGYYKANGDVDFSTKYSLSSANVCAQYAGGFVGVFEGNGHDVTYSGTANSVLSGKQDLTVNEVAHSFGNTITSYGGIFGQYANTSLTNTFTINGAAVTAAIANSPTVADPSYFGGAIGEIRSGNTDAAAYVYVDGNSSFTISSGCALAKYFGGIVGSAGIKGSMLDIGNVTVSTHGAFKGGGIVGYLNKGVLRLSGTTNMSGAQASSGGQLVGTHGDSLVYAVGTGKDESPSYGSGWRFVRSTTASATDDIGTWGEVVRIPDIEGKAAVGDTPAVADIVSFDDSAHTAKIAAANTAITNERVFTQTALNMKLNGGSDVGALCFADKSASSKRDDLLKASIEITGTIDLSGTGITGLMRDNNNDNKFFNGSITGYSNATVKLAVGERYGVSASGTKYGTGSGETNTGYNGVICTHSNNGLIARTGAGVTSLPNISDVKIDGVMNITATGNDVYAGGAVAYVRNGIELSGVDTVEEINYCRSNGDSHFIGGMIGYVYCAQNNNDKKDYMDDITIDKSASGSAYLTVNPTITVTGELKSDDNSNGNETHFHSIGGLIGFIDTDIYQKYGINISNINLSAKIDALGADAAASVSTAGLIADILSTGKTENADVRNLKLTNVIVKDTSVKNTATATTGGILGYRWNNTNVEFDNVKLNVLEETVNTSTVRKHNTLQTNAKHVGGLVYKATGHWVIGSADLAVNSLNLSTNAKTLETLGVMIHDGHFSNAGVFLELTAADSYTLAGNNALTIPMPTEGNKVYDELVAFIAQDETELLKNGTSGVISIHNGTYSMNGSSCNSYQNTYNATAKNKYSRYYYNVDGTNRTSPANGWKLLVWSLNRYAATNIKKHFKDPFYNSTTKKSIVTGTFDLNGISYYPIDIGTDVTLSDVTIKFYNPNIEATENLGAAKRLTRDGLSQHYTMHCGLFRNVTKAITATGDIHLRGDSGITSASNNNAAFIGGTLTGSFTTSDTKQIYLEGLTISDSSKYLLINSVGSDATLELYGLSVKTTGNEVYTATEITNGVASSLIGDVVGSNINLDFKNIKLDSRTSSSASGNNYGTSKSIFTGATLLNKLDVDSTSKAKYNYSHDDDWGTSGGSIKHNVTYGREIIDSQENSGNQNKYYETSGTRYFTRPDADPASATNEAYSAFNSNDYLPYVKNYKTGTDYTYTSGGMHELKVNVLIAGLTSGCGTYNDPYVISTLEQLEALDKLLRGDNSVRTLSLPVTKQTQEEFASDHWCTGSSYHAVYTLTNGNFGSWTFDEAREYLAGAYYQINGNIDILTTSSFAGLGDTNSSSEKYAFRGVIVGNGTVRITNYTVNPFIRISNGAVVKGVDFTVNIPTSTNVVTSCSNTTAFAYTLKDKNIYYGAVMGEIMGGDNIIDDVTVTYTSQLKVPTSNNYLYTIGGFVGVVVNGGLMFRNMPETNLTNYSVNTNYQDYETVTVSDENEVRTLNSKHLYINPYVGRVINGYAINEVDPSDNEDAEYGNYTLDNSAKNYRIPDIITGTHDEAKQVQQLDENDEPVTDPETGEPIMATITETVENYNRLDVDLSTSNEPKIKIPDGQSLFILSLITQSGAGTATGADSDYQYAVAYDGTTRYNSTCAALNAATHVSQYSDVGINASQTGADYVASTKDAVASNKAVPYIIYNYTKAYSNTYPARTVTGYATPFKMELTTAGGTYNLPDCFRGIGSICRFISGNPSGAEENSGDAITDNSANDEDGKFSIKLYGFEGNGSTININLLYNTYSDNSDNYIFNVYNGANNNNHFVHVGFGLFNYLKQKPNAFNDSKPTYNLASGYYVGNFTMTGTVSVSEYNSSGTLQPGNAVDRKKYSVGGISGVLTVNDYVNMYKCDINSLTVTGTSMVGGYIGRCNVTERNRTLGSGMDYIFANGCNTNNLIIYASNGYCGGMVAGSKSGYLCLYVNTARNTNPADSDRKGADKYYKSTMNLSISTTTSTTECGTGGILGSVRNGYDVELWVNNVTLEGCSTKPYIKNNSTATDEKQAVGGFFGWLRKAKSVIITNSTVRNVDIIGPCAGGFLGFLANETNSKYFTYGVSPKISIYNSSVYVNDDTKEYTIEGKGNVGGLAGYFITPKTYTDTFTGYDGNEYVYDIDNCEVYGYTISQTADTDKVFGAGGIIGYATTAQRTVVNTSVHDCIIKTEGSNAKHGMGGIVGATEKDVIGYNITSFDNTFQMNGSYSNAKRGNFIGYLTNSQTVKIVGFSAKDNIYNNTGFADQCGGTPKSGSYIVCADYNGTSQSDSPNTAFSGLTVLESGKSNIDDGPNDDYFPYVVVNPKTELGESAFLTGDGSALYDRKTVKKVDGVIQYEEDGVTPQYDMAVYPAAKAVVDDLGTDTDVVKNNLSSYNGYTATNGTDGKNDKTRVEQMLTNAESASDPDLKLTTYFTEIGKPNGYKGEDFPIIAIDGSSSTTDYTNYITSYIRLMTNTSEAYTGNIAGKYKINIYRCRISNTGDYDIYGDTNTNTGIKLSSNQYSMDNSFADTYMPNNQISLIDVQFYDPTNSDKIAYHLYVPVLTKKMLNFRFYSSVMQGTEYKSNLYNDFGNANPGSFDNWITSYIKYEYAVGDINTYLNSGKGLNWNCDKAVTFEYSGQKAVAGSTQFILLDNNNGKDREFYLTKSDDSSMNTSIVGKNTTDTVRFSNFTTQRGNDTITFRPQDLNDLAGTRLHYSTSGTKMYSLCADQTNPTDAIAMAYDSNEENPKYFKAGGDYSITLTGNEPLVETYYLGVYAFSSDNSLQLNNGTNGAYGIVISCPKTLSCETATCKRSNADATPTANATLYLGDIFTQTLTLSGLNPNHIIDGSNHEITATITSTVSISDTADSAYFQQGLSGKNIYQAFMLCLKQYDKDNKLKSDHAIKGAPQYGYTLNTTSTNTEESVDSKLADDALYVPVGPIAIMVDSYDNNPDWSSTQTASVNVVFSDDVNELDDEFHVQETGDKNGVGVSAYAKLDYSSENIFYSSNTESADNRDKYYMTKSDDAILVLTAEDQSIDDGYDKYGELSCNRSSLGINAKYDGKLSDSAEQTEHIDVKVDFDITNLPDTVLSSGNYSLSYKFELYQKQDDGEYHLVNIKDYSSGENTKLGYLENFTFTGSDTVILTDNYNEDLCYFVSDEMELDSDEMANWNIPYSTTDKAFSAIMSFDVKTKGKLQRIPNYLYSNYQVKVTANLISKEQNDRNYQAISWIVYTNAKVNAQYVSPAN